MPHPTVMGLASDTQNINDLGGEAEVRAGRMRGSQLFASPVAGADLGVHARGEE